METITTLTTITYTVPATGVAAVGIVGMAVVIKTTIAIVGTRASRSRPSSSSATPLQCHADPGGHLDHLA